MRILRVAQKLYPETKGGGAYHVHAMSRDQASLGHNVTVLTVTQGDAEPHIERRDGYDVVRFPSVTEPVGNSISPGVMQFLQQRANRFDIVHAHSHLYFSTNLAAAVRRLGGPPLAITNHGLYSQTAARWLFDVYLRTVARLTFDSADVVFCYTDADRDRLRERDVSTEIAVVPNGIDRGRFSPEGPQSDLLTSEGPTLLFVGRFVDGKRPTDALVAFRRVVRQYPDSHLYFVGKGPLRAQLETQIEKAGLEDHVTLTGTQPYDAMPEIYRSADVLILPSRAEGVPRTVLEAMATDVPVVVSDLPQIRTVVAGGGECVPVGEHTALAQALVHVLDSRADYEPMAATREYEWKRTVRKTTAHLERVSTG
ncbi:glycosyltransferase family 4 protein [Haloarcula halophila]|uniref:glycosyltransferase family 4 protein n=1 Tax=Haloarcula TaxID=2237 RepID=UPI0023E4152C|nr:glycosyltransferase family 4 protein [Halomicroarcula sp. DFY41]